VNGASGPGPRVEAFVDWTIRWGKWLWIATLVLAIPATWRTADLYSHLRTELEQLLPRSAPSVVAIDELKRRLPGLQHLGVVVDTVTGDNVPAADRFLDDLAVRIRGYPPGLVKVARVGDAMERAFLEDHAPLYMDLADLETIAQRRARRAPCSTKTPPRLRSTSTTSRRGTTTAEARRAASRTTASPAARSIRRCFSSSSASSTRAAARRRRSSTA